MAIEWALRDVDKNDDKKISLEEFMNDYLTQPVGHLEHYDEDFLEEEKTRFHDDFDRDGNGFIEGDELKFWIGPDNTEIAIEETGFSLQFKKYANLYLIYMYVSHNMSLYTFFSNRILNTRQ